MKKFLILNPEGTVVLGSYIAEEKDETSAYRSYLLCPPHAVHYELLDGLNENHVVVGEGILEPSYEKLISLAVVAQEEILDEETGEVIQPAVEAQNAVYETIPAVVGTRLIFSQEKFDAVLASAKVSKLEQIRAKRDEKMLENDKEWLIAAKKKQSTSAIEVAAQVLRDLPEVAAAALEELETVEEISAYDAFGA